MLQAILIILILIAIIGVCSKNGAMACLPFLFWWVLLFVMAFTKWPGNLDKSSDGLPMFFALFALGGLMGIYCSRENKERDREYLNSLSPNERERVLEARMRAFIEFQQREEQRRQHEEQLRRDLDIIDKHYRKR